MTGIIFSMVVLVATFTADPVCGGVVSYRPGSESRLLTLDINKLVELDTTTGVLEVDVTITTVIANGTVSDTASANGNETVPDQSGFGLIMELTNGYDGIMTIVLHKEKPMRTDVGEITSQKRLRLRSLCLCDLEDFPFDSHNCVLNFSMSETFSDDWSFTAHTLAPRGVSDLGPWALDNFDISTVANQTFSYNVSVSRKPGMLHQTLVLPAVLLAFSIPFLFLLHPENRDRVIIYVIIMAILTYLMCYVRSIVGDYTPVTPNLVSYYATTIVIDVICMLLSIFITQLYSRSGKRGRVPSSIRPMGCSNSVCFLDAFHVRLYEPIAIHVKPVVKHDKHGKHGNHDPEAGHTDHHAHPNEIVKALKDQDTKLQVAVAAQDMRDEWRQFTLLIDRILFVIFFCIFVVYTSSLLG